MRKKILFIASFVAMGFAINAQVTTILTEDFIGVADDTSVMDMDLITEAGSPITAIARYENKAASNLVKNEATELVPTTGDKARQGFSITDLAQIENGKTYTFTVEVKSSTTENVVLFMRFLGAANIVRNHDGAPASDWTTLTATANVIDKTGLSKATFEVNGLVDQTVYVKSWSITVEDYDPSLSNEDLSLSKLSVYPNPSSGVFEIVGKNKVSSYSVFNSTGKTIMSVNSSTRVDLSASPKGLYFVRVQLDNGNTQVVKAIVE